MWIPDRRYDQNRSYCRHFIQTGFTSFWQLRLLMIFAIRNIFSFLGWTGKHPTAITLPGEVSRVGFRALTEVLLPRSPCENVINPGNLQSGRPNRNWNQHNSSLSISSPQHYWLNHVGYIHEQRKFSHSRVQTCKIAHMVTFGAI